MTAPSSPHANVSVNRWLVSKLEDWLEANAEVRTPFGRTKSDVLNLLMVQFLIQVAGDNDLEKLDEKVKQLDIDVHKTIERFILSRKRS